MRQIKILTVSLDLALSNTYLQVIKQLVGPKIFNEKVEVLFAFFYRIKPQLSYLMFKVLEII